MSTFTVLHRPKSDPFKNPMVTAILNCLDYNHAKSEFELMLPDEIILGIYPGDISHQSAMENYHAEHSEALMTDYL